MLHLLPTILDAVDRLNALELSLEDALKQMIRVAIAHELVYPNQGKVLLHEAMQNEGKYFKLTGWDVPIGLGMKLLQRGIAEGCFRPHNPWLMIHIMGVITFYFNAENNLKNIAPDWQWQSAEAIEEFTESAVNKQQAARIKNDRSEQLAQAVLIASNVNSNEPSRKSQLPTVV